MLFTNINVLDEAIVRDTRAVIEKTGKQLFVSTWHIFEYVRYLRKLLKVLTISRLYNTHTQCLPDEKKSKFRRSSTKICSMLTKSPEAFADYVEGEVKFNILFMSNLISSVRGNILILHRLEIVLYTQAIKTLAQQHESNGLHT